MKIHFTGSSESSKELEYNNANICSILDFTKVSKDDNGQLNFEDVTYAL